MKITLLVIGKTDKDYIKTGILDYESRLKHYITCKIEIIPSLKNTGKLSKELQKEKEGKLILSQIQKGDFVVLLDEKGKEYSSVEFANFLERKIMQGIKNLVFVIGGPYGFSSEIYQIADKKLSLSRMTFSHQIIRLIFMEQLYRSMTILKGEPYHHS